MDGLAVTEPEEVLEKHSSDSLAVLSRVGVVGCSRLTWRSHLEVPAATRPLRHLGSLERSGSCEQRRGMLCVRSAWTGRQRRSSPCPASR
ncbi:hypothetical protein DAT35_46555 [Vitiosangium sp. GDMCC 1.1324]|nr:hypothetical protein DAT35_46555 [Vitiosangium sp. GDMCC 1.1324]